MKYCIFLGLFLSFLSVSLKTNSQAHASDWSVIEYSNGSGINAVTETYIGSASPPIWSTLLVDFAVSRRCAPGLGFMVRNNRNLGQVVDVKYNPALSLLVEVNNKSLVIRSDALVNYTNGFEILGAIKEQSLLDALMTDTGVLVISIYSSGKSNYTTKFSLMGSAKIIRNAYNRCKARLS